MIWEVELVNDQQLVYRLIATAQKLQVKHNRRPGGRLRTTVIPREQCREGDPFAEYARQVADLRQIGYAVVREHHRPSKKEDNRHRQGWPPCTEEPPEWFV
jgi:hypothetical protein